MKEKVNVLSKVVQKKHNTTYFELFWDVSINEKLNFEFLRYSAKNKIIYINRIFRVSGKNGTL